MTEQEKLAQFEQKVSEAITGAVEKHVPNMVEKAVTEKVEATIKEKGLDKLDLKHGNFPGFPANDQATTKKERAALFIKSVFKRDFKTLAEEFNIKSMNETVDSQGGFTVPTELSSEILRIQENVGLIRKLARRMPMRSDSMEIPKKATGANVVWIGEANEGSDGSPTLGMVRLEAKKAMGLAPFSNELLADATANVVQFVTEQFGEALAEAEDFQAFRGTGTPFTGILNEGGVTDVTAPSGATTVAALTLPDWRAAMTPLKVAELMGGVWAMHKSVWEAVQTIQEGSQTVVAFQQQMITTDQVNGGIVVPVGMLWSKPVYLTDQLPDVTEINATSGSPVAVFGNYRNFALGDRQAMTMAMSSDASMEIGGTRVNAFASDQQIMRVLERVSLKVVQEEGFAILSRAA